jgi:hypothetical protein
MSLQFRYSGGETNYDPGSSRGGKLSSYAIPDSVLHNLYYKLLVRENSLQIPVYRCLYVRNGSSSSFLHVYLYISEKPNSNRRSVETISLGLDPAGVGDGISTGVATWIPSQYDIPSGVAFVDFPDEMHALDTGHIPPGYCRAVWIKRYNTSLVEATSDTYFTLRCKVDPQV